MKRKVKLKRINAYYAVLWISLNIIAAFAFWFFREYYALIFFLLTMVIVFASCLGAKYVASRLVFEIKIKNPVNAYRLKTKLELSIYNPSKWPVTSLAFKIAENNIFLGKVRNRNEVRIGNSWIYGMMKQIRKEKTVSYLSCQASMLPGDYATFNYELDSDNCGQVDLVCYDIEITDILGFFTFSISDQYKANISLIPSYDAASQDMIENDDSIQKVINAAIAGGDDPEILDFREYQPGDKLNSIHWKLSEKTGKLMVKEFEDHQGGKLSLALELYNQNIDGINTINESLEVAYTTIYALVARGYSINLYYYSSLSGEINNILISSDLDLDQAFATIVADRVYDTPDLMKDYVQAMGNMVTLT